MAAFRHGMRGLFDAIFPLECVSCSGSGSYCCHGCLATAVPTCRRLHAAGGFDILCGYGYADPLIRRVVHDFKYERLHAARSVLVTLIRRWARAFGHLVPEGVLLVPVPLHHARMTSRGFNQAEWIALALGKEIDLPVAADLLFRVRRTGSQTAARDREGNVTDAFRSRKAVNARIFLVDDVVTSGATLRACAAAIAAGGAECMGGFAFACGHGRS